MKSCCIIAKINEISSNYNKIIVKRINQERLPILQNHIPLFFILPEDGTALLFNEIASIWKISKSSLSDIINKYEAQELIKKCSCPEDKRSVYILLTGQGLQIKQKLQIMESELLNVLLNGFDNNQREIFEDGINKALKNIEEMV
ncbi:MAG: MarR family transcriptional regulator [Clostridia bacterium]|jgi:DNA-binding MarR family transcriptional regulator|nr:MarR family transcriptional regulator [Clostridia bacterium]